MIRSHCMTLVLSAVALTTTTTTTFAFTPRPATRTTTTSSSKTTRTVLFAASPEQSSSSSSSNNNNNSNNHPKNSDRAHIEKQLEDAMDNDWRVFRAKLVAQEKLEAAEKARGGGGGESMMNRRHTEGPSTTTTSASSSTTQKELNKNGQLGEMFAGAISSIFNKKDSSSSDSNNKKKNNNKKDSASSTTTEQHRRFDGDSIETFAEVLSKCEDPFVSESELPSLLESKVTIDKARWAHSIPHVEPGCVLVANEKLGGVFHQTVVLVIDHSETQGSTGMIINRPLEDDLETLALKEGKKSKLDLSLKLAFRPSPVTYGGPVNADEYSILHGFGQVEGSRKLATGVFVGGSEELMMEVRTGRLHPRNVLFVKGHAAWVGGQLDREITKGVWYPAAASTDMILRYAGGKVSEGAEEQHTKDLWADILTCMGDSFATKAQENAGRGDKRVMP